MAWTATFDYTPGQVLTAANLDTYLSGNMNETAPGKVTTAGDIVYATAANTITRLGITNGGLLKGGASAPSWLALTSGGILIGGASAPQYSTPQYAEVLTTESTNTTSYTDLATAGPSITVNCPNGIAMIWAEAAMITDQLECDMVFGVRVDATDPTAAREWVFRPGVESGTPTGADNAREIAGGFIYVSGLSSGNHTFKLRYKVDTTGTNNFFNRKIMGIGL